MIATTAKSQNWEKNIASVPWSLKQKIKFKKKETPSKKPPTKQEHKINLNKL
jgi:hypothetical protein